MVCKLPTPIVLAGFLMALSMALDAEVNSAAPAENGAICLLSYAPKVFDPAEQKVVLVIDDSIRIPLVLTMNSRMRFPGPSANG